MVNIGRDYCKEERRKLPRDVKTNWFRSGGHTATIMVPTTPGSTLAKGYVNFSRRNKVQ